MEKRGEKRRGGNTVKRMGSDQVLREILNPGFMAARPGQCKWSVRSDSEYGQMQMCGFLSRGRVMQNLENFLVVKYQFTWTFIY